MQMYKIRQNIIITQNDEEADFNVAKSAASENQNEAL